MATHLILISDEDIVLLHININDLTVLASISEAGMKSLTWDIVDIPKWFGDAARNKIRMCTDQIVKKHSAYQPDKLTVAEKEQIVLDADIETAAQRQAKFEAEFEPSH